MRRPNFGNNRVADADNACQLVDSAERFCRACVEDALRERIADTREISELFGRRGVDIHAYAALVILECEFRADPLLRSEQIGKPRGYAWFCRASRIGRVAVCRGGRESAVEENAYSVVH